MATTMESKSATSGLSVEVGIRELRDGLSRYLSSVARGDRVVITDHGKPVAQITRLTEPSRMEQLVAEGRVIPTSRPKGDPGDPIDLGVSVVDHLDR